MLCAPGRPWQRPGAPGAGAGAAPSALRPGGADPRARGPRCARRRPAPHVRARARQVSRRRCGSAGRARPLGAKRGTRGGVRGRRRGQAPWQRRGAGGGAPSLAPEWDAPLGPREPLLRGVLRSGRLPLARQARGRPSQWMALRAVGERSLRLASGREISCATPGIWGDGRPVRRRGRSWSLRERIFSPGCCRCFFHVTFRRPFYVLSSLLF